MKASEYMQNQIITLETRRNYIVMDIDMILHNLKSYSDVKEVFKVNENTADAIMGYAERLQKACAEKKAIEERIKELNYIMNLETE